MIGCGRPSLARKHALVALLLACALGVQMLLAGMALASAASPSGEAAYSQSCASAPASGQDPLAPSHSHDHGLCCILHTAFAGPSAPISIGERLTLPVEVSLAAKRENQAEARAPPELDPLAPRGPPTLQI